MLSLSSNASTISHKMWLSKQIRNAAIAKFRAFCKHSTLHGFYYFNEERHWSVYAVWSSIIIASFALCVFLSHMIWLKFVTDPTFTVVETTHYSTTKIPFPAVTVCDTDLVYGPNTKNISYILQHRSFDEHQIAAFYNSFTDIKKSDYNPPDYLKKMHKALNDLGYTHYMLLDMFSKPCDVLMVQCTWRGEVHNCTNMFRKVYTVSGFCCQFDMQFFTKHADTNTNFLAGVEPTEALAITVNGLKVTHTGVVSAGNVWMFIYDDKNNITVMDSPTTLTPAGLFDVNIYVWAIESSNDVQILDISDRNCLLPDELTRGHTYFQECMSINVLRKVVSYCRCLPFNYSASRLQVKDVPNCTWDRLMCVYQSLVKVKSDIKDIVHQNDCLERCDYVQYATEIGYVRYQRKSKKTNDSFSNVCVHFTSTSCLKYKREVIYSWDQMLANLGGIFGLCLGGSIISVMEIVWFVVDFLVTLVKGIWTTKTAPKKKQVVFTLTNEVPATKVPYREKIDGRFKFVN